MIKYHKKSRSFGVYVPHKITYIVHILFHCVCGLTSENLIQIYSE